MQEQVTAFFEQLSEKEKARLLKAALREATREAIFPKISEEAIASVLDEELRNAVRETLRGRIADQWNQPSTLHDVVRRKIHQIAEEEIRNIGIRLSINPKISKDPEAEAIIGSIEALLPQIAELDGGGDTRAPDLVKRLEEIAGDLKSSFCDESGP